MSPSFTRRFAVLALVSAPFLSARAQTPPPAEHLPRLEKLTVDSPRTVLRHHLLANYPVEELHLLADELGIDWEQLEGSDKRAKTRALLLYLYRRERLAELLDAMHAGADDLAES